MTATIVSVLKITKYFLPRLFTSLCDLSVFFSGRRGMEPLSPGLAAQD